MHVNHLKYSLRYTVRGFSLLEVILAVSLLALFVVGFAGAWVYGEEATVLSGNRIRALLLAEEGLEAVRNIRDANFSNLTNGTFGLSTTTNQWNLAGSSNTVGIFTRSVTIGSIDLHRKIATSTVTWQQNNQRTGTIAVVTELTHWLRNWAFPQQAAVFNIAGNQDATKIQVQGDFAYVIRPGAANNFLIFNIANPLLPLQLGQLALSGNPSNIFVQGNFAYVSSTDNAQELQIINVTVPSAPVLAGSYNDANNADATSVFVSGTVAYLTLTQSGTAGENEFVTVNVSTPGSPSVLGTFNIAVGTPFDVVVLGNFAYLATSDDAQELKVINVTAPGSLSQVGSLNLALAPDGLAIAGFGTTAVMGRGGTSGLWLMSVATPAVPTLLGSIGSTGDLNDLSLGNTNTYVFAATGDTAGELKIFNITTPASPSLQSIFNNTGTGITGALTGVAHHGEQDRTYVSGSGNSAELVVYGPQ